MVEARRFGFYPPLRGRAGVGARTALIPPFSLSRLREWVGVRLFLDLPLDAFRVRRPAQRAARAREGAGPRLRARTSPKDRSRRRRATTRSAFAAHCKRCARTGVASMKPTRGSHRWRCVASLRRRDRSFGLPQRGPAPRTARRDDQRRSAPRLRAVSVMPAPSPSFPCPLRHSREGGNPGKREALGFASLTTSLHNTSSRCPATRRALNVAPGGVRCRPA